MLEMWLFERRYTGHYTTLCKFEFETSENCVNVRVHEFEILHSDFFHLSDYQAKEELQNHYRIERRKVLSY